MKQYTGFGLLILACLTLVGCSTQPIVKPMVIAAQPTDPVYPRPTKPAPTPPQFMVLGEEHQDTCPEVIEANRALVCLNPKQYEVLARGFSQIIGYLHELESLVEVYERERRERNDRIKKRDEVGDEGPLGSSEKLLLDLEGPGPGE